MVLVGFGDPSPGASQSVPLRSAQIGAAATAGVPAMLAFLTAQQQPYRPAQASVGHDPDGQSIITVKFDAPSPLGLLSGP